MPDAMFAGVLLEPTVVRFSNAAAGWLLTYLVHSTLILLAAWLLTSWKALGETTREIVWKCALIGGLVTATAQMIVEREPLGGQLRLAPRTAAKALPPLRVTLREAQPSAGPRMFVMRPPGQRWTVTVTTLWLTAAGTGLLWLTLGHARTLRALGERSPLDGSPIGDRMWLLLEHASVRHRIDLTCSSRIASPIALAGNEVCLPRRALLELDGAEQDTMLAHEIAHLVRRDPQWLIVARVIELVLFMQPLNRLARRRMQESAEYLCDDWAVACTSRPVVLAKCLAAVAEWVGRAPLRHPVAAMVETGGSPLVRRVGRILRGGAPEARSPRAAIAVSVVALAMLAGVAPRVSVASAVGPIDAVGFVRAIVRQDVPSDTTPDGAAVRGGVRRDTIVFVRAGARRARLVRSVVVD